MADKLMDAVAFLSLDNTKFKKSARDSERSMHHMADQMEDQIVRVTGANVRLANSQRNVALSTRSMSAQAAGLSSMAAGIGKLGVAMAAYVGVAQVAGRLNEWAALGDSIEEASQRTGIAVGTLSRLSYAANLAGTNLQGVELAIRNMQRNTINDPARKVTQSLDAIGLSAAQLKAMGPEQSFFAILQGLSRVGDESARAVYALNIFGRAGTSVLPLVADGMAGLNEQMEKAGSMGAVFTEESAARASRYADALSNVSTSFDNLMGTINTATPLLDAVSATLEATAATISAAGGVITSVSNAASAVTEVVSGKTEASYMSSPTSDMEARRRWLQARASQGSAYGVRGLGGLDPKLRAQAASVTNNTIVANANFVAGPDMKRAVNRNKASRAGVQ